MHHHRIQVFPHTMLHRKEWKEQDARAQAGGWCPPPQAEGGVAGALGLKLKTYAERCSVCWQCFNSFEWEYLLPGGFSSLPQDQTIHNAFSVVCMTPLNSLAPTVGNPFEHIYTLYTEWDWWEIIDPETTLRGWLLFLIRRYKLLLFLVLWHPLLASLLFTVFSNHILQRSIPKSAPCTLLIWAPNPSEMPITSWMTGTSASVQDPP